MSEDTSPMTPDDAPVEQDPAQSASSSTLVLQHLGRVINKLQREYTTNPTPTSWAQATLAKLRAGDMWDPGSTTTSWQLVFEDLPDRLIGRGDGASPAERVIHQVLTLYAVHQQGRRSDHMHVPNRSLGRAARELAWLEGGKDPNAGVVSRFHRLSSTNDERLRLTHLRSMITMLRAQRIPLDHAGLGRDLYQLLRPEMRTKVQLRWARDFHHRPPKRDASASDAAGPTTTEQTEEIQS